MLRSGKEHLESLCDGRVVYVGSERIAVIWCHRTRPLAPLLEELQRTQAIGKIDNCAIRVFAVTKASR